MDGVERMSMKLHCELVDVHSESQMQRTCDLTRYLGGCIEVRKDGNWSFLFPFDAVNVL